MKSKGTRTISALLAAILAVGLAAGCSGPGTSSDASGSDTSKTNTSSPASGEESGVKDMQKREFKFVIWDSNVENPMQSEDGYLYKSFRETEKKFNCTIKVEYVEYINTVEEIQKAHLSGTPFCDAVEIRGNEVIPARANSGMFLPISDYVTLDESIWNDPMLSDNGYWNNKWYGLPFGSPGAIGIYYNRKLLQEANVPDLWEYVNNDTWNWTTFKEVCAKLTKDTNNDGKMDQFAIANEEPYAQFILTNGASFIEFEDGKGSFELDSDASLEAIEYVNSLMDAGYIPTADQVREYANSAFEGMPTGKQAMFPYTTAYSDWLVQQGMKASEIGWVYFPKGPQAKEYVCPGLTDVACFMVPEVVEAPEDVCAVLADALAYWSPEKESQFSLADEAAELLTNDLYVEFLNDENNQKLYMEGSKYFKNTYIYNYPSALNSFNEMFAKIRSKELTPKAAVDSYKDKIQILLQEDEAVD